MGTIRSRGGGKGGGVSKTFFRFLRIHWCAKFNFAFLAPRKYGFYESFDLCFFNPSLLQFILVFEIEKFDRTKGFRCLCEKFRSKANYFSIDFEFFKLFTPHQNEFWESSCIRPGFGEKKTVQKFQNLW